MYIDYLANHPEHVTTVVHWIYNTFVLPTERTSEKFENIKDYFEKTNTTTLPITLVAIIGNECVGTVSIVENDLKTQEDLTPWLASLYVSSKFRNQGIAKVLIHKVIANVKQLGYSDLYLRTENTADYYRRLGWQYSYTTQDEKEQTTQVFKVSLID